MNFLNSIIVGFKEIGAHKFRSILTMLSIAFGVASLVAMSALVKGMEHGMKEALVAMGGAEKFEIEDMDVPANQRNRADEARGNNIQDVYALQHNVTLANLITPEIRFWGVLSHGTKVTRASRFAGTWPNALEMNQHVIEHGRMFTDLEDRMACNVCVIGTGIRDGLFGSPADTGKEIIPVGQTITLQGTLFTVVGMFKHYESEESRLARERISQTNSAASQGPKRNRGSGGPSVRGVAPANQAVFNLKNNTVYVPFNTIWTRHQSGGWNDSTSSPPPIIDRIYIRVPDVDLLEPAIQQARNTMLQTHRGIEDFAINTSENWTENITKSIRNARLSGGLIAGISLIVGGIGIMNIMLSSITERIREIGIRKAVGGTNGAIFIQILTESTLIAALGGAVGLAGAQGVLRILSLLSPSENAPIVTAQAMWVALLFSVCVGIVAGFIPALKAAKLDPIQALRYE